MLKSYQNYLIKIFLKKILIVFLIFFSLSFFLNILSEVNFFSDKETDVGVYYPIFLTSLNLPSVLFEIFPFIFLISAQLFYLELHEKNELMVFRNFGIDNFKLIKLLLLTSFVLGVFIITIFYTFSSNLKYSYLFYKNKYSQDNKYLAVVNENGLWIKEEINNQKNIINAEHFKDNQLLSVTISRFDKSFNLIETLIASSANLEVKKWKLNDVNIFRDGQDKKFSTSEIHITNFDKQKIYDLFSDLYSLSIFELLNLKRDYEKFGYSTTEIQSHLHNIFVQPLYFLIMAYIGSILMFNSKYNKSKVINIIVGVLISVIIYYLNYFITLMGKNEIIPILPSIWISQIILFILCIVGSLRINEK